MKNTNLTVWLATLLFLVAANFQCYLVVERIVAAGWAWYKFRDYGGGGHIMLSPETSVWFVLISIGLLFAGFGLCQGGSPWRKKIIKFSQWLIFLDLIFYLLLSCSPLNRWRP